MTHGGGKSWAIAIAAAHAKHKLNMADRRLETPEVRMWLNECERRIFAVWPLPASQIYWSMNCDPWDWRGRAARFLDEVAEDVRSRIEARSRDVLRPLLQPELQGWPMGRVHLR